MNRSSRRRCRLRRDCPTDPDNFLPLRGRAGWGPRRVDDRVLLHQVHPVKLVADISASLISNTLLWWHQPVAGIVTRYALPIAGSAIVLSAADVERLRWTVAGRYVLANYVASCDGGSARSGPHPALPQREGVI